MDIVKGMVRALEQADAIGAAVDSAEDRDAARAALMKEPFNFSEFQAQHILWMPVSVRTKLGRSSLREELDKLELRLRDFTSDE